MGDLFGKRSCRRAVNEPRTEESAKTSKKVANEYLTYDVLRIIFRYLNGQELSSASMVCRFWLEAANDEKRTRGPVCLLETCDDPTNNEEACSIGHMKVRLIKKSPIKPALGLFFTNMSVPFSELECHCKALPRNCDIVSVTTRGTVINNIEYEESVDKNVYVCAFLPELPDVKISTFTIGYSLLPKTYMPKSIRKRIHEIITALNPSGAIGNRSKCLLLLSNLKGREIAERTLYTLKHCYRRDPFPIWGGVAEELVLCSSRYTKSDHSEDSTACVAFTLTGAIDTWSVILTVYYSTKERVEKRLKLFKDSVRLKKHSIGLMFACCARGKDMFREDNVESSIFKKLFPEVPLVGCIGYGEFGRNTLSNEGPSITEKLFNQMSTVFLIITYG